MITDQCQFNRLSPYPELLPIMKPTRFIFQATSEHLARELDKRGDRTHEHVKCDGHVGGVSRPRAAQVYTTELTEAIARGFIDDYYAPPPTRRDRLIPLTHTKSRTTRRDGT